MSARIGQSGEVETAPRVIRDKNGFISTEQEWMGFYDEVLARSNTLAVPWRIENYRGPVYRLTTSTPGNVGNGGDPPAPEDQVVTVWGFKPTQQRRDLYEIPGVAFELRKITDLTKRTEFLKATRDLANGVTVHLTLDDAGNVTVSQTMVSWIAEKTTEYGLNAVVISGFLDDLTQGVDQFLHNSFALVKKRIGPAQATNLGINVTLINVAVSTSTLLGSEPSMPNSIAAEIASLPSTGAWIRSSDELDQLDSSRIEIHSEWIWAAKFSTFIYGIPL